MYKFHKLFILLALLASAWLIYQLMSFSWYLFGDNYDFPPTWYGALTILLTLADILLFGYITVQSIGVFINKVQPWRIFKVSAILLAVLTLAQISSFYTYSMIPQWDFQDSWFDDLNWPSPGRISADCTQPTTTSTLALSIEEAERIAHFNDWQTKANKLQDKTAVAWRGWIRDTTRYTHYANPEQRPIDVYLKDPYGQSSGPLTRAELYYFSPSDIARLSVGQEILICGRVGDASYYNDVITVGISRVTVNPLSLPEPLVGTKIPDDFLIEYEDSGCERYSCPYYKLTIESNGEITYERYNGMQSEKGIRHTTASSERIRQLVFELSRSEFFSVEPQQARANQDSAITITARMNGISRTITSPWPNGLKIDRMNILIGKIKEVSQVQQWVR